jgi:hypothetical protein
LSTEFVSFLRTRRLKQYWVGRRKAAKLIHVHNNELRGEFPGYGCRDVNGFDSGGGKISSANNGSFVLFLH